MKNFPTMTGMLNSLMAFYKFRSIIKRIGNTQSVEIILDKKGWKYREYASDIASKLLDAGWTQDWCFFSSEKVHVQLSFWHEAGFTSTIDITHTFNKDSCMFSIIVKEH